MSSESDNPIVKIDFPRSSSRRLSLFKSQTSVQLAAGDGVTKKFTYPADYPDKIHKEIEQWESIVADVSNHYARDIKGLKRLKVDNVQLTDKQLEFLSGAIDYDKYVRTAKNFINLHALRVDKSACVTKYQQHSQSS